MAHFAQLDDDQKVIQVIVVSDDDCGGGEFPESEQIGQAFIASLGIDGVWVQTSYNHNFRRRYAGLGAYYLPAQDIFTQPSPYESWHLVGDEWTAPIARPSADGYWEWNESEQKWQR